MHTQREITTTMRIHESTARLVAGATLALGLTVLSAPLPLLAQDPPPAQEVAPADAVNKAEMVHYVELQLTIDSLQEEAIQEMVRIHSEDGRAQIRNNLTQAIAAAHEEHGMTPERYKVITFLVSSDTAVRELFETTMAEAREGGGGNDAA